MSLNPRLVVIGGNRWFHRCEWCGCSEADASGKSPGMLLEYFDKSDS